MIKYWSENVYIASFKTENVRHPRLSAGEPHAAGPQGGAGEDVQK